MFSYLKRNIAYAIFGLVLILAAAIRFWAAPFSTGPDVGQFWAFAEVFRQHGLNFYHYAGATGDIFPFQGWTFAYPPIWLLILGLAILGAPHSTANVVTIDTAWRVAAKMPIILADLAVGILLFWGLPGSKWRKLVFATLWLLNPTAWYNSAVFGQFDAIASALLVAALLSFARGRTRLGFCLGILAVMTKQTTLIPVAMITVAFAARNDWGKTFKYIALMAGIAAAISLPFLVTGNFRDYFQSLFFSAQRPDYVEPLIYSFNGFGSLATYLHLLKGWDTLGYFWFVIPVTAACGLVTLLFVYLRKVEILRAALIGILLFVILYYRINYQYLVLLIALALMVAATTPYLSERIMSLALAFLPAVWLWIFDVSFWFTCYEPKYSGSVQILSKLRLTHPSFPDSVYTLFALALTLLCLAYFICSFVRWRAPLKKSFSK